MKKILFLIAFLLVSSFNAYAGSIAQDPLFISAQADPRVMLVASRDHQLFIKAYTDYSDLDGDGFLETGFAPYIEYEGYFNPRKCYTYQNSRFEPMAAAMSEEITVTLPDATQKKKTQYYCAGTWSGNLLNWASMTRVDILRKVLYGGYRSTDTEALTVLERAHLPRDVHAFAKVFAAGNTANMYRFTPYSDQTNISFCNLTNDGASASKSSTNPPVMQIADGSFRLWASNEHPHCGTGNGTARPTAIRETLNVRVKVCDDVAGTDTISGPGPKCKVYPKGMAKKPIGILQQYGDADVSLSLKFGLMTGSWAHGKDGGVLRKNIGSLSNSSGKYPNNYDCTVTGSGYVANSSDEIDFCNGTFVNNQGLARSAAAADDLPATVGGIIGTLNRLRIAGWNGNKYDGTCGSPGATSFENGNCVDWGNPISEMYLESLRYLRAGNSTTSTSTSSSSASPTTAFDGSDANWIAGLPQLSWRDPIPAAEWCAKSNILLISTGLNSFDTDSTANDLGWPTTVSLTNSVTSASYENLTGNIMIGSVTGASNYQSVCSSKVLGDFSLVSGVCPEVPSVEGSYHVAGLALGTALYDLRPGYKSKRQSLWEKTKVAYSERQPLNTFAIALAESLPNFTIPVGTGEITFLPFCQANSTSTAGLNSAGWRACSMVDLEVEPNTAKTAGSFKVVWEDSTWGNDHDMDGVAHMRYCVGAACNTYAGQNGMPNQPLANTLYLKVASMTAAAGHALKYGYTISGSTTDGTVMNVLRPGNSNLANYSANNEFVSGNNDWTFPAWVAYTPSAAGSAEVLNNPLWYAAKYAAWPNWDVKYNDGTNTTKGDGVPDNFFQVRNPAGLDKAIGSALKESLGDSSSSSSVAANSTKLDGDNYIYQARFKAADWSGQVLAYPLDTAGTNSAIWDAAAADKIPSANLRRIYSFNRSATFKGIDFSWESLSAKQKSALDSTNSANSTSTILDYLRGDKTNELVINENTGEKISGYYRARKTSVFGDVINSDPLFVGIQNYAYETIAVIPGYDTYHDQVLKKVATATGTARNPLILVNANDGMMHAIDAKNGNEVFTYIPSWLLCADETAAGTVCGAGADSSPLRNLFDTTYQHRYYLDGGFAIGDAYIDLGSGASDWRTVVVGAAAAGGKGIFALDVTATYDGSGETAVKSGLAATQTAYAGVTAAKTALWEFTDKNYSAAANADGDANLGYTFGTPVIGRVASGDWVAIFGNGYGGATGKAVLYIVNLASGKLIKKIEVGDGSTPASPNGLSSPAAIFDSSVGALTVVYAGDIKGNLWKFDLSSVTSSSWAVAHGSGVPLFVARDGSGNRQPITAPLEIGKHSDGGYMVYFGTGKYFEKNDNISSSLQAIYAIWDKPDTNDNDQIPDSTTDTAVEKAAVLQKHAILFEGNNPLGSGRIGVSDDVGAVSYSGNKAKRGWYLDLEYNASTLGERVVTSAILRNKRIIFTTMIPNMSPCEFGGNSTIWEFDPMSGNRLNESVFDLNGDGLFDSNDYVSIPGLDVKVPANGIASTEGMIKSPAIISAGSKEYKISSGTTGNLLVVAEKGSTGRARASWRQVR